MSLKDLLSAYLYNKSVRCTNEYLQLRDNVWYRKPDEEDLLEQIIAKARLDMINEITFELFDLIIHR